MFRGESGAGCVRWGRMCHGYSLKTSCYYDSGKLLGHIHFPLKQHISFPTSSVGRVAARMSGDGQSGQKGTTDMCKWAFNEKVHFAKRNCGIHKTAPEPPPLTHPIIPFITLRFKRKTKARAGKSKTLTRKPLAAGVRALSTL